ncbi:unnamed protein product [marine sediment metagenome]|uniref:Uncharacterized protein n=1 Tax=marine sediment metagenome TaxID=412755 RepID=X0ZD21_9ZZZZ
MVEEGLEELKAAIEQALMAEIVAQTSAGNTLTLVGMGEGETDVDITDGSTISALGFVGAHGRQAMNITVGDTTYEHIRVNSDTMLKDIEGDDAGNLLDSAAGQLIAKAGWNYLLVEGDGSDGAHNPSFTIEAIEAAINALQ